MSQPNAQAYFGATFKSNGSYSSQEWQIREDYYLSHIKNLYVPPNCTTKDVAALSATISNILGEARWDMMNSKRQQDQWSTICDSEEKIQFNTVKNGSTQKLTVDEVKGLVIAELQNANSPVCMKYLSGRGTLAQMVTLYENRFKFMDSIVKVLNDKSQTLIIQSSMLKLDSSGSGSNIYDPTNIPDLP